MHLADHFRPAEQAEFETSGRKHMFSYFKTLTAFISKQQNWRQIVNFGNIAMFENSGGVMD
ncbi:hypothetical protein Hamer_G028631 [Homarus americanus]|uniref:Uncharacterized protein n=1 Tax=Homarus americanus TaxID=6706 RepID=A0A8J5MKS2_HOMAM|nr:hypothetical protein Hamer_G028631 [Homarus americanus]